MTQWGLDTLFNPAKRFMDEEKQRLQSTREEAGDSSGGKRIDLESGKVIIERVDDEDDAHDGNGAEFAAGTKADAKANDEDLTPAQRRARERRAKMRRERAAR